MTTVDTLLLVDTLPVRHDSVLRAHTVNLSLGGKGMVTALALDMLGCAVSLALLKGTEPEATALINRELSHASLRVLIKPWLRATYRTWIMFTRDGGVVTAVTGGVLRRIPSSGIARLYSAQLARASVVYITTEEGEVLRAVARQLRRSPRPVVLNLNQPLLNYLENDKALRDGLLSLTHLLVMNKAEAEQAKKLLGLQRWQSLKGRGPNEIVITDGARGGTFSEEPFTAWKSFKAVAPDRARCVVGAGDTFAAGLIYRRFICKATLGSSCRFAAALAGRKTRTVGSHLRRR